MSETPKLSYIVLSYNYRRHVGQALESILSQTVDDFEVIIVDDASSDDSPSYIRSFEDPRIKLYVNETNIGGAASYNRAIGLAQGEFLVNLDADDWVAPEKAEKQLAIFASDPSIDVVGTYINVVNSNGDRHDEAGSIEAFVNRPLNLNAVESWVVQNPLCRSSTMMRRNSHMRIGLDEPSMIYACDFELWTRALKKACRFAVIPKKLTSYRVHNANVTNRNTKDQLIEIIYLLNKNVVPIVESQAARSLFANMVSWIAEHNQFASFHTKQRHRLVASLLTDLADGDFNQFRDRILTRDDAAAERMGRTVLALSRYSPSRLSELAHFIDVQNYERAKSEWFVPRIESLEGEIGRLRDLFNEAQTQIGALEVAKSEKENLLQSYEAERGSHGRFAVQADSEASEVRRLHKIFMSPEYVLITNTNVEIIEQSGLFDGSWYRALVRNIPADMPAALHYFLTGGTGSAPGPRFDAAWYLQRYPDVAEAGVNPLVHYSRDGRREGRETRAAYEDEIRLVLGSVLFNEDWYRSVAPPIPSEISAALHYIVYGKSGISPSADFDAAWYLRQNPDVAASGINPLIHYLRHGRAEGRKRRQIPL